MLSAFANAFRTPDLRKKILFTLGILAIFRLGSIIPTPNVNAAQVNICLRQATSGDQQGLYSLINLFSVGALLQLAIFALGNVAAIWVKISTDMPLPTPRSVMSSPSNMMTLVPAVMVKIMTITGKMSLL